MVEVKRLAPGESGYDGEYPLRRGPGRPKRTMPKPVHRGMDAEAKRQAKAEYNKRYAERMKELRKAKPLNGRTEGKATAALLPKPAQAGAAPTPARGTLAETAELLEQAAAALRKLLM